MFEEDLIKNFKKLGLKSDEAKIYLSCLRSQSGLHIQEIADQTKIKRSTVNLMLGRLIDKKFISYHFEGARRIFLAESPQNLLYNFQETIADFKGLVPLLLAANIGGKQSKVRFFEGAEGLNQIFHDMLLTMRMSKDENKEILSVTSSQDLLEILPDHIETFIKKRIKYQIPIRWIAPNTEVDKGFANDPKSLRKMKFFDLKKYPFHIEMDIYANKIAMMSTGKEPSGIIIENETLAESFKAMFNLIWDSLG